LECKFNSFCFLGYTFCPRAAQTKDGRTITGYLPAISKRSQTNIQRQVRSWKLKYWTQTDIQEIALKLNPIIQGWLNYYCAFYSSKALSCITRAVNSALIKWVKRNFKKNRNSFIKSCAMIKKLYKQSPTSFAHWKRSKTFIYNGWIMGAV